MPVIVSMLRGINVGGHNRIRMDSLRAVYESIGLRDPHTYIQSGNVVFQTDERDLVALAQRIEIVIEGGFGFRPSVVIRTLAELRAVVARNPFAERQEVEPSKLLVTFLASDPGQQARDAVLRIKTDPEELRAYGRELYIYFPNGMARPKYSAAAVEKALKLQGTGRNWNTAMKLLEIAERLEAGQ